MEQDQIQHIVQTVLVVMKYGCSGNRTRGVIIQSRMGEGGFLILRDVFISYVFIFHFPVCILHPSPPFTFLSAEVKSLQSSLTPKSLLHAIAKLSAHPLTSTLKYSPNQKVTFPGKIRVSIVYLLSHIECKKKKFWAEWIEKLSEISENQTIVGRLEKETRSWSTIELPLPF